MGDHQSGRGSAARAGAGGAWMPRHDLLEYQRLQEREAALLDELARRGRRIGRLERTILGMADRVVDQSDLLSRAAEKEDARVRQLMDSIFAPDIDD